MKRTNHADKDKMPVICTAKDARKIVTRNGWVCVRKVQGHWQYKHPDYPEVLTICNQMNPMTFKKCIKKFNIDLNA